MNDLECLKINYDVDGWKTISEREGNHCIVPLGAVYAIRSLIEEVERLRAENNELGAEMQRLQFLTLEHHSGACSPISRL